mgnify:CR=1 FL=1
MDSPHEPLHSLPLGELTAFFEEAGLSSHQARTTFQALHRLGIRSPEKMTEISSACRAFLKTLPPLAELRVDTAHTASDGTVKLRLLTPSNDAVESVIIPGPHRVTLCVSSQVGCAAGCTFCHTGTMGLLRNLSAWEIVDQHRLASQHTANPITNIVFMGMGEPLHNEASVTQALRILGEPVGAGFSKRHLVMSTAGVGNRIRPFWEQKVASLSLSLHATTDETRDAIVPLNKQWNLAALKQILLEIPWRRNEFVFIAYLLLEGVNDSRADAERLAAWTAGLPAKVNLLEFNPYPGSHFGRTSETQRREFRHWLDEFGVFNTLRISRGDDVMAACGQLAVPVKQKAGRRQ